MWTVGKSISHHEIHHDETVGIYRGNRSFHGVSWMVQDFRSTVELFSLASRSTIHRREAFASPACELHRSLVPKGSKVRGRSRVVQVHERGLNGRCLPFEDRLPATDSVLQVCDIYFVSSIDVMSKRFKIPDDVPCLQEKPPQSASMRRPGYGWAHGHLETVDLGCCLFSRQGTPLQVINLGMRINRIRKRYVYKGCFSNPGFPVSPSFSSGSL